MKNCEFERINDQNIRCKNCGHTILTDKEIGYHKKICGPVEDGRTTACNYRTEFAQGWYCRHGNVKLDHDITYPNVCLQCGQKNIVPITIRPVPSEFPTGSPPPIHRQVFNFAKALLDYVVSDDKSFRMKDEISEIKKHCEAPCPFYNGRVCTHSKCGCGIGTEQSFFSKLARRDQVCPDGRWT